MASSHLQVSDLVLPNQSIITLKRKIAKGIWIRQHLIFMDLSGRGMHMVNSELAA
jgi:hypothetical protein